MQRNLSNLGFFPSSNRADFPFVVLNTHGVGFGLVCFVINQFEWPSGFCAGVFTRLMFSLSLRFRSPVKPI